MKDRYILTIDGSIKVMFETSTKNSKSIKKIISKMMCWSDKKCQLYSGLFISIAPSPAGGYIEIGREVLVWLPAATMISWAKAVYNDQTGSWEEEL